MDPQPLSPSEWAQIGTALKFLWAALGCAIVAGFSLLTAHAIITSLVDTNTIPSSWSNLRPVLYFVGIIAVIGGHRLFRVRCVEHGMARCEVFQVLAVITTTMLMNVLRRIHASVRQLSDIRG